MKLFFNVSVLAALLTLGWALAAEDASPLGTWRTIDDKTNKIRGTVLVYEKNGEYFAKITSTADPKEASETCNLCPGDRKDKPIVGLVIMEGMKKNGSEYSGGDVLDPDTGSVYHGKFKLTDGGQKLVLRGYIGLSLLGRSQTWIR